MVSHWNTPKVMTGLGSGPSFRIVYAHRAQTRFGHLCGVVHRILAWYGPRWSPSEVNIATSATTGATHASTGSFSPSLPFSCSQVSRLCLADGPLVTLDDGAFTLAFIGIVASMFAGFLGVMYFIIFRRVWLVEDPLPLPGSATLKMLDISSGVSTGAVEHARDSLKTIGVWTVVLAVGLFLVEYPLIWLNIEK